MDSTKYAMGQAVYIRTDTPDYEEMTVPFHSLEELVTVCITPRDNASLEKILVYSMVDEVPVALTLGFVAASKGQRPGSPEMADWQA